MSLRLILCFFVSGAGSKYRQLKKGATDTGQEVWRTDGREAGIVFCQPGKPDVFWGLAVDQPCVVLPEKAAETVRVPVALFIVIVPKNSYDNKPRGFKLVSLAE